MSPGGPVEMQEAVALCAERAAGTAVDYGDCGPVIVVGAERPRFPTRIPTANVTIAVNSTTIKTGK